LRHLRAISTAAATAAFCLVSSTGWAQQVGDQNNGLLETLTQLLRFDPLLVAAIVIALTLVVGLVLDTLRGRFRRSEGDETPAPN